MSVSFARRPFAGHRRLLGVYFAPQRGRIALVATLVAADILLRLVNPQVIRLFLDTAAAGGPLSVLTTAGILYLVVGIAGRFVNLGSSTRASAWGGRRPTGFAPTWPRISCGSICPSTRRTRPASSSNASTAM